MTRFATNGIMRLAYTVDGPDEAEPLLLVNGLGSPLVAFEPGFVSLLVERGFQVARFDNRDTGRSGRAEQADYGLDDMAADAAAVLDEVGWQRANVAGQSMGGMIAQQLAIEHPDRVISLISVMSATGQRGFGRATPEAVDALLQPAPATPDEWLDHRVRTERIWASPQWWDESWVVAKGQAMIDWGIDAKGATRQYRAVAAAPSRDDALSMLSTPTLVIHGSADTLISLDGGRHTAEVVPGARYVEIEGMGHDLPPALWGRLVDEISAFVESIPKHLR